MPPARNRRTSEGCPGVALRATRGTAIISLTAIPNFAGVINISSTSNYTKAWNEADRKGANNNG